MKFYAVKSGRKPGIYTTWAECQKQVNGYSGAVYKSFLTEKEALDYISEKKVEVELDGLIAYVDGSFNKKTLEYGYGCVLLEGQNVIEKMNGKGNHLDYVSMRNVAGEILGATKAIEYAIAHQYSTICIYYDYEGIENWAEHSWKANKAGTQKYQQFIDESRKKIQIHFIKVLAHSGDLYNEMADRLAKNAVGIQ